jgi:putative ABC transport system permease protein
MSGPKQFTVRGIMKSGGLNSAFGGNLAVMDVYAAQKTFGRGRVIDRIDLAVQPDASVDDVRQKLTTLLGPGYQVEAPSARAQQFENLSQIYAMTANITSLFALFIGMFIIFNTFSIAVTQRRSEIGILRALGATGGQLRRLFLMESAALGLIGSALGVLLGIAIARAVAGNLGQMLGELYGVAQHAEQLSTSRLLLSFSLLMGVVTSLVAAWIPASNAAKVDPVQALQKGKYQTLTAGENRTRRVLALCSIMLSVVLLYLGVKQRAFFYAAWMLTVFAALLLAPTLALLVARVIRPILRVIRPVEGTLAADSLIQAPRRTSGTVSALMLSLALVVSLGGLAKASYASIRRWIDVALNPDFFVTATEKITRRDFLLPASIEQELAAVEGVEEVQPVRSGRVLVDGRPVMLVASDIEKVAKRAPLPAISGGDDAYARTARGEGLIVSDNFALLRGYRLGDSLEIATPTGLLRSPILSVRLDYSDQQGSVLIDRATYRKYWKDDSINIVRVYARKGADLEAVRRRILQQVGRTRRLFVLTNQDLREYILRLTDQWFGITYIQIAVAVLVAILGIVNTLTVSITDRRRELGVLRAVGGLRNQIRRTIWMEAFAIAFIGLVLGLALGAVQLGYSLEIARLDLAGIRLSYEYPFEMSMALLPIILAAALLAAFGPAETAVRGSLVEALEYE